MSLADRTNLLEKLFCSVAINWTILDKGEAMRIDLTSPLRDSVFSHDVLVIDCRGLFGNCAVE